MLPHPNFGYIKTGGMKYVVVFLIGCFIGNGVAAQILKKIGKDIKNETEWRIRHETRKKVNQAFDSLGEKSKKNRDKKRNQKEDELIDTVTQGNNTPGFSSSTQQSEIKSDNPEEEIDMNPKQGYLDARVKPDKQVQGIAVEISGETMISDKLKEVEIVVYFTGKKDDKKKYTVPINTETGAFKFDFRETAEEGEYRAIVRSSDGKGTRNLVFHVYGWPDLEDIAKENLELLRQAETNLREKTNQLKEQTAPRDDQEIDRKMEEVQDKIDDTRKLLEDLSDAIGKIGKAVKTKGMPASKRVYFGELNSILRNQADAMKDQVKHASHQPADNSICEYLVIINEACAAFSTITNFYAKSIGAVLLNLTTDKAIPKIVETENKLYGAPIPVDHDFWIKEPAKIFAIAKADAASLSTKLGKAGIAGDLLQYISSVLLKAYCVTYSGDLKFHYDVTYRDNGNVWWQNGYDCGGSITLRYPKSQKPANGVIKMKGNIEGNATRFTFSHDVAQLLPKTSTVIPVVSISPPAMPFVSSKADIFGFGAVARTAGTPASFYLNIDAEYNVETGKIKLFYNDALWDFSPAVRSRAFFVVLAVLPLPHYQEFPIMKMGKTFNATLKRNSEFPMKGGEGFTGKAQMHLPYGEIEHKSNFTMNVKRD
jgi:hypothetical protein